MQINRNTIHFTLIYVLIALMALVVFFKKADKPAKTAYVNTINLYNDFLLTKELGQKLDAAKNVRKEILDSLMLNLKLLNGQVQASPKDQEMINRFTLQKQNYLEQERLFGEDNERQAQEYNTKVWTQLNQYVEDYGKQEGFDYIYGADGSGSLMYASDAMEITNALKEFVNLKYQGKAK